jgi:hypothetical protein
MLRNTAVSLVAALNHHHVVTIHGIECLPDASFLVIELVEATYHTRFARSRYAPRRAFYDFGIGVSMRESFGYR